MNKLKSISFVVFALLLSSNVLSQNLSEDLKKISKTYKDIVKYKCSVTYSVYMDNKIHQTETGIVKVDNSNYHMTFGQIEVFNNSKANITLDHNSKVVLLNTSQSTPKNIISDLNWDSLINMVSKQEFKKNSATDYQYTLTFENGVNESMIIHFNPLNHRVFKIKTTQRQMEYISENKQQKLSSVMIISNFQTKVVFSLSDFDAHNYLSILNTEVKLKSKINDYRVLNGLETEG